MQMHRRCCWSTFWYDILTGSDHPDPSGHMECVVHTPGQELLILVSPKESNSHVPKSLNCTNRQSTSRQAGCDLQNCTTALEQNIGISVASGSKSKRTWEDCTKPSSAGALAASSLCILQLQSAFSETEPYPMYYVWYIVVISWTT